MSRFLDHYVHLPLQAVLAAMPSNQEELPDMLLKMSRDEFAVSISGESLIVKRKPRLEDASPPDSMPDDVDEDVPGL